MRHEVRTKIGGSVESHVSSVGQQVTAGGVLLTVECMKTMFPVEADVAGIVAWLKPCGETVETDDVVARIDE